MHLPLFFHLRLFSFVTLRSRHRRSSTPPLPLHATVPLQRPTVYQKSGEFMAQIPNLQNGPINFTSIRDQSQKELLTILKNIRGKKCLVIDPKLGGSLSLVVQTSLLKGRFFSKEHL
ncbi:putative Sec1-like superfamily, Sec1-like, domain 1 protein [Helianthus debilis subsp. tardiflorus]